MGPPDQVDVDNRVKKCVVDRVVDVSVLIIVQPAGLHGEEPGVHTLQPPVGARGHSRGHSADTGRGS